MATIKDKKGYQMYFYRKSDGTFWERVHIPLNSGPNERVWDKPNDYVQIISLVLETLAEAWDSVQEGTVQRMTEQYRHLAMTLHG